MIYNKDTANNANITKLVTTISINVLFLYEYLMDPSLSQETYNSKNTFISFNT